MTITELHPHTDATLYHGNALAVLAQLDETAGA